MTYQNIFGRFGWWLNGRVLKRAHLPRASRASSTCSCRSFAAWRGKTRARA